MPIPAGAGRGRRGPRSAVDVLAVGALPLVLDVPGIFVYEQTFRATRYDLGAAASIVMLVMVAFVIVPYLARSLKEQ